MLKIFTMTSLLLLLSSHALGDVNRAYDLLKRRKLSSYPQVTLELMRDGYYFAAIP